MAAIKSEPRSRKRSDPSLPPGVAEALERLRRMCRYHLTVIEPARARAWADVRLAEANLAGWQLRRLHQKAGVYGRSMAAGTWAINGDAIIFDEDGNLVDGLARLLACAESGHAFPTIVFEGVPKEASVTLGSHLKRTASDILDINGERSPRAVAFAWTVLLAYLNTDDRAGYAKSNAIPVSPTEMMQLTDRYPHIRDSATLVTDTGAAVVLGDGLAVACHFIMSLIDKDKADAFMRIVGDPTLDPLSAPAALSGRISNLRRTPQAFRFALAIKAWNRFAAGNRIGASGLVFNGQVEGKRLGQESFPVFDGLDKGYRLDLTGITGEGRAPVRRYDAFAQVDQETPPTMEIVYFRPEDSEHALENNGPAGTQRNRTLRKAHYLRLARDMLEVRWVFNAQSLKFSMTGRLIDGQHRSKASVESGVGFITFVVRGLDDSVFSTYDGGEAKNFARHLREQGVGNSTALAAALGMLSRILNNENRTLTVGEGFELRERHPGLEACLTGHGGAAIKELLPPSVASVLYYLFGLSDAAGRDRFFHDLAAGGMLPDADPVLKLRNALMLPSLKSKYPLPEQKAKIAIQAWNARRQDRSVRTFTTTDGFATIL